MRLGELLALRWRSVDLKATRLHVEPETEKAGRGRVVPLTTALVAMLKTIRGERPKAALDGSDLVFRGGDGEPWERRALQREFEITAKRCDGIAAEKRGAVSFHVLRHTAGTLLAEAGVPLRDIAGLLGQSVPAVTARYAHYTPAMGERAVDRLARALSGAG